MNISDFCERYGISRAKGRRIERDNPDWFEPIAEYPADLAAMRARLANGDNLSALQLCALIENPQWEIDLGEKARKTVRLLGPLIEPAPRHVAAMIEEAARRKPDAIATLIGWLRAVLPASPVNHAWIAVRLLMGIPANMRENEARLLPRALFNCRKAPEFAGWWRVEKCATIYQKSLAAFDL